jgi:hypothetical protein
MRAFEYMVVCISRTEAFRQSSKRHIDLFKAKAEASGKTDAIQSVFGFNNLIRSDHGLLQNHDLAAKLGAGKIRYSKEKH